MATPFPSSSGTAPLTLAQALNNAQNLATSIKTSANNLISQINSGTPVSATSILSMAGQTASWVSTLNTYAGLSGMAAFAAAQLPLPDTAASFAQLIAAITAVNTWIVGNTPTDASSYLEVVQYQNNTPVYATYTAAQLAGLLTALNTLVAAIN